MEGFVFSLSFFLLLELLYLLEDSFSFVPEFLSGLGVFFSFVVVEKLKVGFDGHMFLLVTKSVFLFKILLR